MRLPNHAKTLFAGLMVIVWLFFPAAAVQSQSTDKTGKPDVDTKMTPVEFEDARRANEEAQAEYYREQTKLLRQGTPTKTLWQNISENPASVLGVLGAVIVAMVTLISFLLNYRVSLNNQMDTQFYEALKRFGDKDSPAVRFSAAGILAQMAKVERRRLNLRHPVNSFKSVDQVYFTTARNQLVAGLLLEEDEIALLSIRDAIHLMVSLNPAEMLEMVFRANQNLQRKAPRALVRFFVASGITERKLVTRNLDEQAAFLTGFETSLLQFIRKRTADVDGLFESFSTEYDALPLESRGAHLIETRKHLSITFFRLRLLVHIYGSAFRKFSLADFTNKYGPLFLVEAWLKNANLEGANLSGAFMSNANLTAANLLGAKLHGTWMQNSNLTDTKLFGAEINISTNLTHTEWWRADYYDQGRNTVDEDLLQELFSRYGSYLPSDEEMLHSSVKMFLSQRPRVDNLFS